MRSGVGVGTILFQGFAALEFALHLSFPIQQLRWLRVWLHRLCNLCLCILKMCIDCSSQCRQGIFFKVMEIVVGYFEVRNSQSS